MGNISKGEMPPQKNFSLPDILQSPDLSAQTRINVARILTTVHSRYGRPPEEIKKQVSQPIFDATDSPEVLESAIILTAKLLGGEPSVVLDDKKVEAFVNPQK